MVSFMVTLFLQLKVGSLGGRSGTCQDCSGALPRLLRLLRGLVVCTSKSTSTTVLPRILLELFLAAAKAVAEDSTVILELSQMYGQIIMYNK